MLARQTTEYLDVFEETIKYTGIHGSGAWLGFLGSSFLILMWFMSGMPGYAHFEEKISSKAHSIVCWVGLSVAVALGAVGTVMAITDLVSLVNDTNKLNDVKTRMEENVAKKYDADLQVTLKEIPFAEDRDKLNDYTLVFNYEDKENRVTQRYEIRFDRATSEPFISELNAPTADELEASAKK